MFTLAHLADLHAPPVTVNRPGDLLSKRLSGFISWTLRRRHVFRREILDAVLADVKGQQADHIAITGDLVNLALEEEFVAAAKWLERIGTADHVSVVPGNHEAYVAVPMERSWNHLAGYMVSDLAETGTRIDPDDFPTVRVRGPVAIVGLCSAQPTGLFRATGRIGAEQLRRLESVLDELRDRGLCRIVQIHHPPVDDGLPARRRLTDGEGVRDVLARAGAELVLHAHAHKTAFHSLEGPDGSIPSVGVRSATNGGHEPLELAQYHLYDIEETADADATRRYRITVRSREWEEASGTFVAAGERRLAQGDDTERSRPGRPAARAAA